MGLIADKGKAVEYNIYDKGRSNCISVYIKQTRNHDLLLRKNV